MQDTETAVSKKTLENIEDMPTPGVLLRKGREEAGLTVKTVAEKLYINPRKVEALEHDQYEKLPSPTFVQGYLRKYAELLKLDGDKLVSLYNTYLQALQHTVEEIIEPQTKMGTMVVGKPKPPKWILPTALFLVAVAVLALVVIYSSGNSVKNERPQLQASQPFDFEINTATEADASAPTAADEFGGNDVSESSQELSTTNTGGAPANAAAVTASISTTAQPAGEDQLVFDFSDECWLEVSDASGAIIHADLHSVGDPVVVTGQAPFTVLLGNARASTLAYNGDQFDFETKPGHRTSRFTVE